MSDAAGLAGMLASIQAIIDERPSEADTTLRLLMAELAQEDRSFPAAPWSGRGQDRAP